MKSSILKKPPCVGLATKVLGDKWSPRLLLALSHETVRFCALRERVTGITPKMLSKRLTDLEQLGIVNKVLYPEVPPRSEYSLTKKGLGLLPILRAMARWGEKYSEKRS